MTLEKDPKDFLKRLEDICDMLNTCNGQYTDTEYKDIKVYDRLSLLEVNEPSENKGLKNDLIAIQRKIREAYLLTKDMKEWLEMYQ